MQEVSAKSGIDSSAGDACTCCCWSGKGRKENQNSYLEQESQNLPGKQWTKFTIIMIIGTRMTMTTTIIVDKLD